MSVHTEEHPELDSSLEESCDRAQAQQPKKTGRPKSTYKAKVFDFSDMSGEELLEIRKSLGLSQSELGRELGIQRQYVYAVESGRTKMPKKMAAMARVLKRVLPLHK